VIAEILQRCEAIEESYEFMLGYAAQGLPGDEANPRVREFLRRAVDALDGLAEACAAVDERDSPERVSRTLPAFLGVLRRDAEDSLAALKLVLAQASISSQLIDNLNASVHLRALLTDLFLLGDVLRSMSIPGVPRQSCGAA
jgi:hypothetical protein